jgi:hypothetical protein
MWSPGKESSLDSEKDTSYSPFGKAQDETSCLSSHRTGSVLLYQDLWEK